MECRNLATDEVLIVPVRDSLATARLEKLEGSEYTYDFPKRWNTSWKSIS